METFHKFTEYLNYKFSPSKVKRLRRHKSKLKHAIASNMDQLLTWHLNYKAY